MHYACHKDLLEIVNALLKDSRVDVNKEDKVRKEAVICYVRLCFCTCDIPVVMIYITTIDYYVAKSGTYSWCKCSSYVRFLDGIAMKEVG